MGEFIPQVKHLERFTPTHRLKSESDVATHNDLASGQSSICGEKQNRNYSTGRCLNRKKNTFKHVKLKLK